MKDSILPGILLEENIEKMKTTSGLSIYLDTVSN